MDTNNLKNSKKKEEEKKPLSHKKIIIAVVMICIAFFGSFLAYFVLQVALNTEAPIVIVVSGSMEPSIREGDLLFVMGTNPEDIKNGTAEDKNGDVIVFDARGLWAGAPEEPIVHRVVDKYLLGDTWYFRTKGDANSLPDQIPVPESYIIGVVIGGDTIYWMDKDSFNRVWVINSFTSHNISVPRNKHNSGYFSR
ncbi:hypothetical protein ES705_30733 [subsurface metagenome]